MNSQKSTFQKIAVVLMVFLILSFGLFYFKNSKPIIFLQGIPQHIFANSKSFVYQFLKDNNSSEIQKLQQENQNLKRQITDTDLLKRENNALKSQFDTVGVDTQNLIAVKIVGFLGEQSTPLSFVINAGENDGIMNGQSVVFQKNLVGVVSQVSQSFSVVTTPFSQKFQTLAKVPKTNANGILTGSGNFMLYQKVVITDTLKKGDMVVTKGQVGINGVGIEPDLTIGEIKSVAKNETSPFQSAQVVPVIDYSNLDYLFVVKAL